MQRGKYLILWGPVFGELSVLTWVVKCEMPFARSRGLRKKISRKRKENCKEQVLLEHRGHNKGEWQGLLGDGLEPLARAGVGMRGS